MSAASATLARQRVAPGASGASAARDASRGRVVRATRREIRALCRDVVRGGAQGGYARVLGRYGVLNWLLFGWA